mgnify:CR=1 FL=1
MAQGNDDWKRLFSVGKTDSVAITWREVPVDFKTFVETPEYSNHWPLSDTQYKEVMKLFGDDPKLIFSKNPRRQYREMLACWGKGSGKGTLACLVANYAIYLLLCMENPHNYFGIAPQDPLYFVNVATGQDQANKLFARIYSRILGTKWFTDRFKIYKQGKVVKKSGKMTPSWGDVQISADEIQFPRGLAMKSLHSQNEKWEGLCVRRGTVLVDALTGVRKTVEEWAIDGSELSLYSFDFESNSVVISETKPVFKMGRGRVLRVTTANKKMLEAAFAHRVWVGAPDRCNSFVGSSAIRGEWKKFEDIEVGDEILIMNKKVKYNITEEGLARTREAVAKANRERIYTAEMIDTLVKSKAHLKGENNPSKRPEVRAEISRKRKGVKQTPQHIENHRQGLKRRNANLTEEERDRIFRSPERIERLRYLNSDKSRYHRQWYESPIAGRVFLHSGFEKSFAEFLDSNVVKWERCSERFVYSWDGHNHHYYPDFKVILDGSVVYIETKGYPENEEKVEAKLNAVRMAGFNIILVRQHSKWKDSVMEYINGPGILPRRYYFDRVVKVEEIEIDDYYDLEVPDTHCYFVNDILSHNTVIGFIADEMSGFLTQGGQFNADSIYNTVTTSTRELPYVGLITSFPRGSEDTDFVYGMYKKAIDGKLPGVTASKYYTWEVKPSRIYSGETFDFLIDERTGKKEKVPIEYRDQALRNPEGFKKRYMCICGSAGELGDFFEYQNRFSAIGYRENKIDDKDTIADDNGTPVIRKTILSQKLNLANTHYITLDCGETESEAALTVSHRDGNKAVIDAILIWKPDPDRGIIVDIRNYQGIALELARLLHASVRFDHWNAAAIESFLRSSGVQTERKNVAFNEYTKMKSVLYSGNLILPQCENSDKFIGQCKSLKTHSQMKPRVANGRQDACDAVVQAIDVLYADEELQEMEVGVTMEFGGVPEAGVREQAEKLFGLKRGAKRSTRRDTEDSDADDIGMLV